MKVKIEYEYDATLPAPYVAKIKTEYGHKYSCSIDSFLDAKNKLINAIKIQSDIIIPSPEEVEI